jgi:Lysyl oxidase
MLVLASLASLVLAASHPLPDLVQLPPSAVSVIGPPYRLTFAASFANVGSAPLVVVASRASRADATLRADQLVGGRRVAAVGVVRYVIARTHRHFHLLGFDRYELLRAGRIVVRDRKTGFCLGDRTPFTRTAPPPRFGGGQCGRGAPGRLRVTEGLSVGWADPYPPVVEGQFLPLAGLPAGRYTLRHTVNPKHRVVEASYANNSASVQLELTWQAGVPEVRVVG